MGGTPMKGGTVTLEEETDHHIDIGKVREKTDERQLSPGAVNRRILPEELMSGQAEGRVGQW